MSWLSVAGWVACPKPLIISPCRSVSGRRRQTVFTRVFGLFGMPWHRGMEERAGFEPAIPFGIHTFQACAIDHSATSPSIQAGSLAELGGGRILLIFHPLPPLKRLFPRLRVRTAAAWSGFYRPETSVPHGVCCNRPSCPNNPRPYKTPYQRSWG